MAPLGCCLSSPQMHRTPSCEARPSTPASETRGARPALDLGWGHPRGRAALVLEELTVFRPRALSLCLSVFLFPTSPTPPAPTPTPRQTRFHSLTPTLMSSQRHEGWGRHAASVKTRSEPSTTCDRKERNSCITDSFPVTPTGSETFNTIFSQAPGVSGQPGPRAGCEPSAPSLTSG